MPAYEIVNVLDSKYLLDSESYQRSYATRGGRVLSPGFYVVTWSGQGGTDFDGSAQYIGPFKLALHAKMKLAQYLDESHLHAPRPRAAGFEQKSGQV